MQRFRVVGERGRMELVDQKGRVVTTIEVHEITGTAEFHRSVIPGEGELKLKVVKGG